MYLLFFNLSFTMTTLQLETSNRGKPTNKKVITNRKNLSGNVPQAWLDEWNWYYNQAGAILECWDLLPTKEQWEQSIEENPQLYKELPLLGYRNYSTAGYSNQGVYGGCWSSSPSGIYGYNVIISGSQVYPLNNDGRAHGFAVRCLKN